MNKQELGKTKKIKIVFSNSQEIEFLVNDLTLDEQVEILSFFCRWKIDDNSKFLRKPKKH